MIDSGLSHPWPREVTEAAAKFEQGVLIKGLIELFFQRNSKYPVWQRKDAIVGEDTSEIARFDPPPYVIVTGQSCDVAEDGRPKPNWPWFQVAPVYQIPGSPEENQEQLKQLHLYQLTAPDLPPGGTWVADLRIELPVEKGELVGKTPIKAFATENEARAFGKYLGAVQSRPAFADALIQVLNETFRKTRSGGGARQKLWRARRDEVLLGGIRLEVQEGSNLNPRAVEVSIWTLGLIDDEFRGFFQHWWDLANAEFKETKIRLLPLSFRNALAADIRVFERTENSGLWQG